MPQYIEVKVKYDKTLDNGSVKQVTEPIVIDAMTCTEAETKAVEYISSYIGGEYNIMSATKTKIAEAVHGEGYWFKAKVAFITRDDLGGEKRVPQYILFEATDFAEAYKMLEAWCNRDSIVDIEVESLALTKIVEVIEYEADEAR